MEPSLRVEGDMGATWLDIVVHDEDDDPVLETLGAVARGSC